MMISCHELLVLPKNENIFHILEFNSKSFNWITSIFEIQIDVYRHLTDIWSHYY